MEMKKLQQFWEKICNPKSANDDWFLFSLSKENRTTFEIMLKCKLCLQQREIHFE